MNKINMLIGLICSIGGVAVLLSQMINKADWLMWIGFGLYFVGKGIFAFRSWEYLRGIPEK